MKEDFIPVIKEHTETELKGTMPGARNLPVTVCGDSFVSVWKLHSIAQRVKFLFTGEISLLVWSDKHPHVAIVNSDCIKEKRNG